MIWKENIIKINMFINAHLLINHLIIEFNNR